MYRNLFARQNWLTNLQLCTLGNTNLQLCTFGNTNLQLCTFGNTKSATLHIWKYQICNFANLEIPKSETLHIWKYQICKFAHMHMCKVADLIIPNVQSCRFGYTKCAKLQIWYQMYTNADLIANMGFHAFQIQSHDTRVRRVFAEPIKTPETRSRSVRLVSF